MQWFNKDIVSFKQEIFSDDAARSLFFEESPLSNVSNSPYPALLSAPKFALTGEKGELRKSLIQLSFLLLFFVVFFVFTRISLIFPRIVINLNLSNPAKT